MQIGTDRRLAERGLQGSARDWSRLQNARLQRKDRVTGLFCRAEKNSSLIEIPFARPIHHLTICKETPSSAALPRFLDCESNAVKY
jgi:hypothetical protein